MQGRIGPDDASRYAADSHDLQAYVDAERALHDMRVLVLVERNDPSTRLFVAAFDGTGNDRGNPSLGPKTNVPLIHEQIELEQASHPAIRSGYVAGPGTQSRWAPRLVDGATGRTFDARLEDMYFQFCVQAKKWMDADPSATISLATIGFSRGAEEAAGFARMVHERGIRDPSGVQFHRNRDGLIDRIQYRTDLPPLRPPGSIAQAELLFDPVGTGEPSHHDRRPPPGVLTGLQIYAEDERRDLFASSHVIDPGLSADGRFLGVVVGGAHSNIGGGYREDGLSRRSLNLGIDFLNALSDRPFLQKAWLRPDLDVVVRSEEHAPIFDDDHYRARERAGVPEAERRPGFECIGGRPRRCAPEGRDAEPVDAALDGRFPRRAVPIGPVPETPAEFRHLPPASERHDLQPTAPPPGPLRLLLKPLAEVGPGGSDPLVAQAEVAVRALDGRLGREYDDASQRMAARVAWLAKAEGLDRIDAVVLSRATPSAPAGTNVFVVQGALTASTNRVAYMSTQEAVATPVVQSLDRIAALDTGVRDMGARAAQRDQQLAPVHRMSV